jgi:hypothetical protein
MRDRDTILAAWSERDRARAVLPADREIIEASGALRSLVVEVLTTGGPQDELFDACAILGRMVFQRGGSPTFASALIDHAADALDAVRAPWLEPARAAVVEGFAAALAEGSQRDAMVAWEYPACAVALGEAAVAIAAGYPSDDDEHLGAWAGRVAKSAALSGIRRAVISGNPLARAALIDALGVVGIEVREAPRP